MSALPVLERGDCRDVLLEMAARGDLFDSCVTDPPYHLTSIVERFGKPSSAPAKSGGATGVYGRASKGFMGKEWDGGDVAFQAETWRLVLDVLKPGAYLLAFGGTRTYHRLAVAIEDAGFEVRDAIMWHYGTGFPKSHNVAKGIDKTLGVQGYVAHTGAPVRRMRPGADQNADGSGEKLDDREYQPGSYIPGSAEAAEWSGYGTALKPATEIICLARKPLGEKTVAANVLRHRVGALNIDDCRVPLAADDRLQDGVTHDGEAIDTGDADTTWGFKAVDRAPGLGRWPANVLHDGSDEVLAAFAAFGERGAAAPVRGDEPSEASVGRVTGRRARVPGVFHVDTGTAARFFYSAKASQADRCDSKHPTVKPLALMRWLLQLVTPPGGHALDPFGGSGTTLQAAYEIGRLATAIERDPEYQADIVRRIASLADIEAMWA